MSKMVAKGREKKKKTIGNLLERGVKDERSNCVSSRNGTHRESEIVSCMSRNI
jgi:hypothetical protein